MAETTCITYPSSRAQTGHSSNAPSTRIQIISSVGRMGANRVGDVRTVQDALNRVGETQGGAMPPLKTDGICGPLTLSAIERFQHRQFLKVDGRLNPNGSTITKLDELLRAKPTSYMLAAAGGPAAALVRFGIDTIPVATTWIGAAHGMLASAMNSMSNRAMWPWPIIHMHFHLDRLDKAADLHLVLTNLNGVYNRMMSALALNPLFDVNLTPSDGRLAEANMGGFHPASGRRRVVVLCPPFGTLWIKSRTAVVVHELAHLVGGYSENDTIKHFAHELPLPNGSPQEGCPRNYGELTPMEAMRNAASYATFAIHAAYSFDNRAGWT